MLIQVLQLATDLAVLILLLKWYNEDTAQTGKQDKLIRYVGIIAAWCRLAGKEKRGVDK